MSVSPGSVSALARAWGSEFQILQKSDTRSSGGRSEMHLMVFLDLPVFGTRRRNPA
jgi:hypothetical protein